MSEQEKCPHCGAAVDRVDAAFVGPPIVTWTCGTPIDQDFIQSDECMERELKPLRTVAAELRNQLAQAKPEIERLRKIELAAVELRRCREAEIDSMLSHDAAPEYLISDRLKAFDALMNQLDQEKSKGAE